MKSAVWARLVSPLGVSQCTSLDCSFYPETSPVVRHGLVRHHLADEVIDGGVQRIIALRVIGQGGAMNVDTLSNHVPWSGNHIFSVWCNVLPHDNQRTDPTLCYNVIRPTPLVFSMTLLKKGLIYQFRFFSWYLWCVMHAPRSLSPTFRLILCWRPRRYHLFSGCLVPLRCDTWYPVA